MTFLKRAWATLTTLPVYAAGLVAVVTEVAGLAAHQLPSQAAGITHAGTVAVAVVGFGSWAVTRLTPVAKDLRGFPAAPLSKKEQDLADLSAALDEAKTQIDTLTQLLKAPPPDAPAPVLPGPATVA